MGRHGVVVGWRCERTATKNLVRVVGPDGYDCMTKNPEMFEPQTVDHYRRCASGRRALGRWMIGLPETEGIGVGWSNDEYPYRLRMTFHDGTWFEQLNPSGDPATWFLWAEANDALADWLEGLTS